MESQYNDDRIDRLTYSRPTFQNIPDEIINELVRNNPETLNPLLRSSRRYQDALSNTRRFLQLEQDKLVEVNIDSNLIDGSPKNNVRVLEILKGYLLYSIPRESVKPRYYYQYEFDSNLSDYETLMDKHAICIAAYSYAEATLINSILKVLFYKDVNYLEGTIQYRGDSFIEQQSRYNHLDWYTDDLIQLLVASTYEIMISDSSISDYDNHVSDYIKSFNVTYNDQLNRTERLSPDTCTKFVKFRTDSLTGSIRINQPIIFDRKKVLRLLSDERLIRFFTDPNLKNSDDHLYILLETTEEENSMVIYSCDELSDREGELSDEDSDDEGNE